MAAPGFNNDPLVLALQDRYPQLIAALSTLPDGQQHLHQMAELDHAWTTQQMTQQKPAIVVDHGEVDLPPDAPHFDIIYAGGGLNLINAAIMSRQYGRSVLVFDRFTVGAVHREWNISEQELQELVISGAIDSSELPQIIQHRYTSGLVHFHADRVHVPPADLIMRNVLDAAIDADALTDCCIRHIRESSQNMIMHDMTFERAVVGRQRVVVLARDRTGKQHIFSASLCIDGMGATSPIANELNGGMPYSLVCPTVGTVATGYQASKGHEPGTIDPDFGEILITTEHARDGRQLIWEAFPGKLNAVAIYLFYYAESQPPLQKKGGYQSVRDQANNDPSILLPLFEQFFSLLPGYKQSDQVKILKPVYGFIPAGYKTLSIHPPRRKKLAFDRVLSLGDAAALQSPLTFCGFGSNTRNVRRITGLLNQALTHNRLTTCDLQQINASEVVPALSRSFSKFLIGKPEYVEPASQVNETMNVFCRVLAEMGEKPARDFFQDHITWWDYTRLVLRTAIVYPRIFQLTAQTLSLPDTITWIWAYIVFSGAAARNAFGRFLQKMAGLCPFIKNIYRQLWQSAPALAWRLTVLQAKIQQSNRRIFHQ